MSEISFTCQNRPLRDVIDLYMSQLTFTYLNRHLHDVIDLYVRTDLNLLEDIYVMQLTYMSELIFTC